ncbi:MAG: helix-turn-helix transcriptional regulator [Ferruginibacter sp.]|nr:helix-turn-helix transcriptional regulator [Cytophagales bacterium]
MRYERIHPPAHLKDYIRHFWILESDCVDPLPKTFGPVADGCPGLIFQQSEKGTFYDQKNKKLPNIFLYGQTTKHTEINSVGKFSTIGIYFYPDALKSIFGFDAEKLTNSCIDLGLLSDRQGFSLSEQLLNVAGRHPAGRHSASRNGGRHPAPVVHQIELLSSYLFFQIKKNNVQTDETTQYILSQIIQSKGGISLKELRKNAQLSERSFERKFKQWVGISPKLFSRVCRFQASLNQLRNNNYDKLSDVAFENGYADQSHFIRSFKEFAGFSPYQYQKQSNEVVENFPQLISSRKS